MATIRLVFYLVGEDLERSRQALMMLASARRWMDVWAVQHTDLETPALEGVDEVIRTQAHEPMLLHRAKMLISEGDGEFLNVDTDMIFLSDTSEVFGQQFDVAMPRRKWNLVPGKTPRQLYNGVTFSRSGKFWRDCYQYRCETVGDHGMWEWKYADRSLTSASRGVKTLDLDARIYNYQPVGRSDDVYGRKILHFKAWRKELMDAYYPVDRGNVGDRAAVPRETLGQETGQSRAL